MKLAFCHFETLETETINLALITLDAALAQEQ